ncbi:respiratory nitrate reductase subunit gamma [Ramlibacter tataouinensis]|uniref:respiratory nitrate reductase subunit gamma n=1 Tax=Ramlibacter tataouinensis TaxID=94132 RepID=UPI0022F3F039|nr:respiratory nitrate reductase subunit gamma [Ramlibacter tataouinensis]WBY02505.1 respiratory nitrate reductase subunit gamma [Ramlibacter tataouinensis]
MNDFLNQMAFGWFPYVAVIVMVVGSILRFDKDQYGWRSQSSQFLRRKQMLIGSNLFHLGVIVLFFGHFVGLLTPVWVFHAVGFTNQNKQMMAMLVGGIAGVSALAGCTLLLHRRLFDARIRRSSSWGDIAVLALIWVQLVMGVGTIYWSMQHLDGREMVQLMGWAHGILTLNPGAPGQLDEVGVIFKLHIILGLVLFLITPFTRLVHIWSVPIWFLLRPGYQIARSRAPLGRPRPPSDATGLGQPYASEVVSRAQSQSGQPT